MVADPLRKKSAPPAPFAPAGETDAACLRYTGAPVSPPQEVIRHALPRRPRRTAPAAAGPAWRRPPQRPAPARHRAGPVADRPRQHGPRLQQRGNPAHPRGAALLVLLLGQRPGTGALAGRAP